VIVSLHVATDAAAGTLAGSRLRALLLGPVLHLAGDRFPHEDIGSRRFEIRSGIASVALLAARRGPLDPATLGALAASAPDLEHVFPSLRPGGEKLFHGSRGWHRSGAFPAKLQLLLAGDPRPARNTTAIVPAVNGSISRHAASLRSAR
jgi:hypothetical protein